jgi:hypothetical protein
MSGSAGKGGSSAGGSGGRGGSGGSGTAGTGGSTGSTGGTGSSCDPPVDPTNCMDADDFCAGYSYAPGDRVLAECMVGTAGCIDGRTMMFECVSACTTQTPGTGVDNSKWNIVNQCN